MSTLSRLDEWRENGSLAQSQFDTLSALVRKDRFSVFRELNALLYLGVLSFVAGIAWTIQNYFISVGDSVIIVSLTLLLGLSLHYCFSRGVPYSRDQVESPTLVFDYVLYLACLVFVVEIGYIETRFEVLKDQWDYYVLVSALLFFVLAYRFDNRFVLSLAFSTLAAWFGLRISRFGWIRVTGETLRLNALLYGLIVAIAGVGL